MRPLTVVKVGGSLYDLPDLHLRLQPWLSQAKTTDIILVPGGGATADVIRDFDRVHHLGEIRGARTRSGGYAAERGVPLVAAQNS